MMSKIKYLGVHGLGHLIDEEAYTEAYQEKGLRKLMTAGVNAVFLMYSWGWPPKAEARGRQMARNFISLCRRNNVRTLAYVQFSNYVWKAFHDEIPESREWECLDRDGNPTPYVITKGRRYVCINSPGWRNYLKGLAREALEAGSDGVFFDNMVQPGQPSGGDCWCRICREKVQEHLASKGFVLSEEAILRRSLSCKDAVGREVYGFRVASAIGHLKELSAHIKSIKDDAVVSSNWGEIDNFRWWGAEPEEISALEDLILMESTTLPRVRRGCVINTVRAYKRARCFAKGRRFVDVDYPIFAGETPNYSVPTPDQLKLGIAEAAACGSGLVFPATERFTDKYTVLTADEFEAHRKAAKEYYSFADANRDLYDGHVSIANVGIFEPGYMALASDQTYPYVLGVEQTLIQSQIPFDIVRELCGNLGQYKVIVLPNLLLLSHNDCVELEDYVKGGGSLVVVGHSGIYDENYEYKGNYGIEKVLGFSYPHETEMWAEKEKARVVFLPKADLEASARDVRCVEEGILLPMDYQLLRKAVLWALRGRASAELEELPHPFVFVEITRGKGKKVVVHLLNYKYFEALKNVKLTVRPSFHAKEAYATSPEQERQSLKLRVNGEDAHTMIPELRIYDVVVLE